MRSATPYIWALCRARARRVGDVSRAMTSVKRSCELARIEFRCYWDRRTGEKGRTALTCLGESNGVAAYPAEGVENRVAAAALSDLVSD
jgi:hypothetical protein